MVNCSQLKLGVGGLVCFLVVCFLVLFFFLFLLQHECFFRRFHRSLVKLLNGLGCLDWQRHCHSWSLASHRLKQQYCFQSGEKIQYEVWNRFLYHTSCSRGLFCMIFPARKLFCGPVSSWTFCREDGQVVSGLSSYLLRVWEFFLWSGFFSRWSMMCLSWEGIFCLFNQG